MLEGLISAYDRNGDGVIDYSELASIFDATLGNSGYSAERLI